MTDLKCFAFVGISKDPGTKRNSRYGRTVCYVATDHSLDAATNQAMDELRDPVYYEDTTEGIVAAEKAYQEEEKS